MFECAKFSRYTLLEDATHHPAGPNGCDEIPINFPLLVSGEKRPILKQFHESIVVKKPSFGRSTNAEKGFLRCPTDVGVGHQVIDAIRIYDSHNVERRVELQSNAL